MKLIKRITAVLLTLLLAFSFVLPAFAAEPEDKEDTALLSSQADDFVDDPESSENDASDDTVLTTEKAIKVALTAAKARFAAEGISTDISKTADVTKVRYDKKTGTYHIIIRAKRIYKYECNVAVKTLLGTQLGLPEDSVYTEQGKVASFFSQGAEKFSYFFIRLFGKDGPKN